jgi:16S rRNA (guanine527-N7)-methyltransferase
MTRRQFNIDKLANGCEQLGITVNSNQLQNLLTHIDLLAKWNKSLNLTAISSNEEMISHHILDSLAINHYIKGDTLLDVGTGAGFPGLPLAIINPNLQVTLLDSRGKRIEFLRYAISTMGLGNVFLSKSRIENYRGHEKFDTLAARAVSSVSELIRLCTENLHSGTRLLALKGRHPQDELDSLAVDWPESPAKRIAIKKLNVPFMEAQRHLIILDF